MAIRKGRSDSPDIDDLMQDINQENQLSQEESRIEEKIAALKEATAALNAAADRADIIIKGLNKAIDDIPTMSIGARVSPDSLKAISDTCNKFTLDVANRLIAYRNKQLEQQKAHEQRIADMLRKSRGLWISHTWLKFLTIIFIIYSLLVILYVKLG